MKKTFLCLGAAFMLLLSCQSDDPTPTPNDRKDIPLTRSELEMTALGNVFAFNFFKTVTANEKEENVFVSPLSACLALSMTANGGAGTTLEEMKTTLGFKDYSLEEMNGYYKKLVNGLLTVDNSTTIGIANSIWIKEGFKVKQPFVDVNKDMYNAEVRNLNFSSPQAVSTINGWCSDKTNKRITKVLEFIDPDARMFLINALYFKGVWKNKFDKGSTVSEEFTSVSGQKNTVDMMHQECSIPYTSEVGLQVAELPYGNEAFSMVVLLPGDGQGIDNLIEQLTPENWEKWTSRLSNRTIDIKLPKFKLKYSKELIEDLKMMGMIAPFNGSANFSNMSDSDLFIGLVKQDTFVEVNEEGTEAAAVTTVGTYATSVDPSQPIPFHVNRPFIYIIKEKSTGAILFMGKMGSL